MTTAVADRSKLATAIVVGSIGAALACQHVPITQITVFDQSWVAFAVLRGLRLFAEIPSASVSVGIALIISVGVLAIRRKSTQERIDRGGTGESREHASHIGTTEPFLQQFADDAAQIGGDL